MARAEKALQSLPWVDQKSVKIDINTEKVEFLVKDSKQYNEEALRAAFAKVDFADTKVVKKPQ